MASRLSVAHVSLTKSAKILKNAAPEEWNAFLNALGGYDYAVTVAVTAAPQTEILQAQGSARQCQALLRIFEECDPPAKEPAPQ